MKAKLSAFRFTALVFCLLASALCFRAFAQGTAFAYQGRLNDGASPANGIYDLKFSLFSVSSNGVIVAGPITNNATAVSNGLFTVTLNFGGVFTGTNYWLDISVRTNGPGAFAGLAPRQPITPVPYAIMANSASNLLGVLPAGQLSAGTAAINVSGSATSFTGSLNGDVTGTQSATVVSLVSGTTAADVASGANAANAATSANIASTIVKRDAGGNFSTASITLDNNLNLPATTATAGIIYSGGTLLMHRFGNNNFFAGTGAGNLTMSGGFNTGIGFNALLNNSGGDGNAAIGLNALLSNTTGSHNTASGLDALASNTQSSDNTATGAYALQNNTGGNWNTANGSLALSFNTNGANNTATGYRALENNKNGNNNTATGSDALQRNTTGANNTADGGSALAKVTTGGNNTASGASALPNLTTGAGNIAIGVNAGSAISTGDNNIDIGSAGFGNESGVIRIGTSGTHTKAVMLGIFGTTVGGGSAMQVNAGGLLGTVTSSRRFKQDIQSMDDASDVLLALKPVTFRYKTELDPAGTPQFGLIAEDVEKIDPDLVLRDEKKQIYSVRYEAVNAMLLNEFLKQHRKVEDQNTEIETLKGKAAKVDSLEKQLKELQAMVKTLAAKK